MWTRETVSSIGNTEIVLLDWRDNDGTLAAATHGKGLYYAPVTYPLPVELCPLSGILKNG